MVTMMIGLADEEITIALHRHVRGNEMTTPLLVPGEGLLVMIHRRNDVMVTRRQHVLLLIGLQDLALGVLSFIITLLPLLRNDEEVATLRHPKDLMTPNDDMVTTR